MKPEKKRIIKRVGLYGGSFDPPHLGHLILANSAREAYNLDYVIFIPCNISGYYQKDIHAPVGSRLRMLRLISSEFKNMFVSEMEIERGGVSYTIDTVKEFRKEYCKFSYGTEFYLILGPDIKLSDFKNPEDIKANVTSIIQAGIDFYMPRIDIRSTKIREMAREGKSIQFLVSNEVMDYIVTKKLYKKEAV